MDEIAAKPAYDVLKKTEEPQPSHSPPQRSLAPFERLPNELLTFILCAASSTKDVHSMIRASPTLLSAFLSVKRLVLVSVVAGDLGLPLRDAVAVAVFLIPSLFGHYRPMPAVLPCSCYESLPPSPWRRAMTLPDDALYTLVRTHRASPSSSTTSAAASSRPSPASSLWCLIYWGGGRDHLKARYCDTLAPWQCQLLSDAAVFVWELKLECTTQAWQPAGAPRDGKAVAGPRFDRQMAPRAPGPTHGDRGAEILSDARCQDEAQTRRA
ncbi:hypothetical protein MAPG_01261 [Magnaporthiopsis poae ATCC 64411]|uniref:Uncharacterized protein n=1 Tax=Magnaporthiopsis poae (strain ATCC 64411 / 73-15) TaxID=644358 RepID=A0A0C4DN82_MAGP6|nr:hypothetical protein MAPG_01261 [Magnaporthiopsis poae ATCC 64411]